MERTNLRTLASLPELIQVVTLDLSFISLGLVLPAVRALLAADARVVALVKPQFEAGREDVPRGGVVREPATWERVLEEVGRAAGGSRLRAERAMRSPLVGGDGNVEFLVDLRPTETETDSAPAYAESVRVAIEGAGRADSGTPA